LTKKQVYEIACEAVKIYFDYNISALEAIEKAKGMIQNEDTSMDKTKKVRVNNFDGGLQKQA